MPDENDLTDNPVLRKPLPQVGALLELDAPLPLDEDTRARLLGGSHHWRLAGSAVRVSTDRVLTIGHVLDPAVYKAVFFPYLGIVPLSGEQDREPQLVGDNLYLVRLVRPVLADKPLRPKRIPGEFRHRNGRDAENVVVAGYGEWKGTSLEQLDGLQQKVEVKLGPPAENPWRLDHLDISFSTRQNGDKVAGEHNSGGPFLWDENGSLRTVGILREVLGDQQAGSWITDQRIDWLDWELPRPADAMEVPLDRCRATVKVDRSMRFGPFPVPKGARRAGVTLNASDGLRLQMRVCPTREAEAELAGIEDDDRSSGRFLHRRLEVLPSDAGSITVAIAPVRRAQPYADYVVAQLCVQFEA